MASNWPDKSPDQEWPGDFFMPRRNPSQGFEYAKDARIMPGK